MNNSIEKIEKAYMDGLMTDKEANAASAEIERRDFERLLDIEPCTARAIWRLYRFEGFSLPEMQFLAARSMNVSLFEYRQLMIEAFGDPEKVYVSDMDFNDEGFYIDNGSREGCVVVTDGKPVYDEYIEV